MEQFHISLAGLNVEMHSRFPLAHRFCNDYLDEFETVHFSAKAEETDTAELLNASDAPDEPHAELLCLLRSIAEQLPHFQRFLIHGAAISWRGQGLLFLAPSGTGKSTHIRLWRSALGASVGIINGDKPIIDASGEIPMVCGTPWAGKESWQRNVCLPLRAVCILRRGKTDSVRRTIPKEQIGSLLSQVYRPDDAEALMKTLLLADKVFRAVPIYELSCTPTKNAVRTVFPTLTGEIFPGGNMQ